MKEILEKLDRFFSDLFLKKAPSLPKELKEILVKILPWLALIFGLMAIPGVLAGFGLGVMMAPWMLIVHRSAGYYLATILSLFQIGLQLWAVSPLMKQKLVGWQRLYWANLLGLIIGILRLSPLSLIFAVLGLYLLYQVKESYK